ncbi:hypothetical protein ACFQ0G_12955 [Streptomyces chiangmaiensis]
MALAVAGAVLAGLLAAGAVERGLDRERAERQQVPAVVTKDAVDATPPTRQVGTPQAWTTVRWRTSDGSTHTDRTRVPPGTRAGTRITVWTDRHGNLASQPLAAADAVFRATVIGGLVAIGTGLTVWGVAGSCAGAFLSRYRLRQWDEEWARIDTRWGGKTG